MRHLVGEESANTVFGNNNTYSKSMLVISKRSLHRLSYCISNREDSDVSSSGLCEFTPFAIRTNVDA